MITPPPGPMAGYAARLGDSTRTTADLMTRVTVYDDGDHPLVLATSAYRH